MTTPVHIFGDEAGNLDFSRQVGASRYFIITTIALDTCEVGDRLLELRRALHWRDVKVGHQLHASEDRQVVRVEVFTLLSQHEFRVDSTIFEKSKAQPTITRDPLYFYKFVWFFHLKHLVPKLLQRGNDLFLIAASFATSTKRERVHAALRDVMRQVALGGSHQVACWPAATDPCLQVADYCSWAIGRKWERNDSRSYDLISSKIATEYDIFGAGTRHYY